MDYLEFVFSGKGNVSRIFDVCKAFYRSKKRDQSLTKILMAYKNIHEELNMLMLFSPDVKVQQSQREQMAVMGFLATLPSEYDSAKPRFCPVLRYHLSRRPLAGFFALRYHPLLHLPLYLLRQTVLLLDKPSQFPHFVPITSCLLNPVLLLHLWTLFCCLTLFQVTLSHPSWYSAMIEEMDALNENGTWNLVHLPTGKKTIGCRWVFAIKVNPDGSVAQLKARLVAKWYTQTYGVDYSDTFSLVAKMTYVWLFISLAATHNWDLH